MIVRPFEIASDYDQLCGWWAKRGLPAVPKVIIEAATGIVVVGGDKDIAAGWCYFDERNVIGLVDWITTNPAMAFSPTITEAINRILKFFEYLANSRGCHNLFSFVENRSGLHRLMVRTGWQDPQSKPHIFLFRGLT